MFRCQICEKIILLLNDINTKTVCCNQEMREIKANLNETVNESHLPIISDNDFGEVKITVSSKLHPMNNDHYIKYIILETDKSLYVKELKDDDRPAATFFIGNERIKCAYEYCTVHGLYKTCL